MNDPEGDMERVLTGLRDSLLPRGMEDRILKALREGGVPPSSRRFAILSARLKIAGASSLAMATALLVIFMSGRAKHASQLPPQAVVPLHSLFSAADTEVVTSRSAPLARTGKLRQVQVDPRPKTTTTNEAAPPSKPAPPIPLTEQERFLLRMVHHGRTEDLAAISNENRTVKERQEAEEFQAFFAPPIIKFGESE